MCVTVSSEPHCHDRFCRFHWSELRGLSQQVY
jgi:hypothetical protein